MRLCVSKFGTFRGRLASAGIGGRNRLRNGGGPSDGDPRSPSCHGRYPGTHGAVDDIYSAHVPPDMDALGTHAAGERFDAETASAFGEVNQVKGDIFKVETREERVPFWKKCVNFFQSLSLFFFVFAFAFILIGGMLLGAFRLGQKYNERDFQAFNTPRLIPSLAVKIADNVFNDTIIHLKQIHIIDRKTGAIALNDSVMGDPSEHIILGTYERDRTNRKLEAALHFYLAASNGHPDGARLYKALNIPTEDYETIYQQFVAIHQMNGDAGLIRLGQHYLGADAFKIARRMRTKLRFAEPNDYIWPRENEAENLAYINFQMASLCGDRSAYEWRAETARYYDFTLQRENALKQRSNAELASLARLYGLDNDDYCKRRTLMRVIEAIREQYRTRAVVRYEAELAGWDGRENPCELGVGKFSDAECDEFDSVIRRGFLGFAANLPTFEDLIREMEQGGRGYGDRPSGYIGRDGGDEIDGRGYSGRSSSQAFRDAPGAEAEINIRPFADDGLPNECTAYNSVGDCIARESALACDDRAKYHFNRGEADMAVGRTDRARKKFSRAIATGRACQSEYGDLAATRLAALNLTCEYSVESLARISRDYQTNPDGGSLIDLASRQRALYAKGHYGGRVDGKYGPATRRAVRAFQRELGFSETGDLTPIQTVYLICSAAQVHADPGSINLLGVMYISGLGVVQNTDAGIRLLKQASGRGMADAKFNLALIYGTGTVASSYRLCGIVENLQQADAYLEEAADAGSGPAIRLIELFGRYGPTQRWKRIKEELKLNQFYSDRLQNVGEGCRPNP